METTTLTRRERERLMRRQAMLEAARAVFAEKGYPNATLDEIAERAEFGKGTLYNYFASKEEILFAIFDELYDSMVTLAERFFDEAARHRPVRDVFRDFIEAMIGHFKANQELFMILVKEVHRMIFDDAQQNVTYFVKQRERLATILTPRLEQAVEHGELRPLPAHAIAHMIMGNVNGYLMFDCVECKDCAEHEERTSQRAPWSPGQAADFLATILFDGLLQHPTPRPNGN